MKRGKRYLVTGGTGFLGAALVKKLVAQGCSVRVFDDGSRGRSRRLGETLRHVEMIDGDIRDPQAVAKAARGVDGIWHLAFVNGTEFFYTKPELVLEVGVKGMMNVLDACLKHDIGELITASSSEVYQTPPRVPTDESAPMTIPDPLNARYSYAAGKMISEILTLNYGRSLIGRVVVFRPHNVYGPDMGFEHVIPQFVLRMRELVEKQASGLLPFKIQGDGRQTRSFIYVDDFIDGLMLLRKRGAHRGIYHIGTTEELTIARLAREVGGFFGRRIELVAGKPAPGGTSRRCPDIGKMAKLGFAPKISLKQGLALTAPWYVAHAGDKR